MVYPVSFSLFVFQFQYVLVFFRWCAREREHLRCSNLNLWVSVLIESYKKGSGVGPTYCLTSCSLVVRALVCQHSGPGSNLVDLF